MKKISRIAFAFLILILGATRSFAVDVVAVSPWIAVLAHFI